MGVCRTNRWAKLAAGQLSGHYDTANQPVVPVVERPADEVGREVATVAALLAADPNLTVLAAVNQAQAMPAEERQPSALELRDQVVAARSAHARDECTYDEMVAVAERYIDAIMAAYKRRGMRKSRPTAGYILRAV